MEIVNEKELNEKIERARASRVMVARWESRGARYAVELYRDCDGWTVKEYTAGAARGFMGWPRLGAGNDRAACYGLIHFGRALRGGLFQADNNKTPMKRTK